MVLLSSRCMTNTSPALANWHLIMNLSFDFLFGGGVGLCALLLCKHPHETTIFISFELGGLGWCQAFSCPLPLCITSSFAQQRIKGTLWSGDAGKSPFFLIARSWLCVMQNIHRLVSPRHFLCIFCKHRQKRKLVLLHHAGAGGAGFGFVLWRKAFWFPKDLSLTRQGPCISVSLAKGASPIWTEFCSDELFMKLQSESLPILSKITMGCFSLSCCY